MKTRLRALAYAVRRGLRGMREAPLVQLLAVSTTAVCMLLLGTVTLAWVNARGVADAWGVDVPITVYLTDDAPNDDVEALLGRLHAVPEIERIDRITPAQAMARLAAGLGDPERVGGIEVEALPASLELELAREVSRAFELRLAERLRAFTIVEEVELAGEWAEQAETLLRTLGDLALGAAALVAFACMAIVWSTIRLAVYARRAEIQILRLVGGTEGFVRGPFLVEGALQGALGAALALGLLYFGFDAVGPFLEDGLSLVFAAGALRFFDGLELTFGIGFGTLVGVLGSRAAAGRYVDA